MKHKAMQLTTGMVTGLLMTALSFEAFASNPNYRARSIRNDSADSTRRVSTLQTGTNRLNNNNVRTVAQSTGSRTYRQARNDQTVTAPTTTVTSPAVAPSGVTPRRVQTTTVDSQGRTVERSATAPTGPTSQTSVFAPPTSTTGLSRFQIAPGPGVTQDANGKPTCKPGHEAEPETSNIINPTTAQITGQTTIYKCKPTAAYLKDPILYEACGGDPYKNKNNKDMPQCASAWNNSDMNTCGKKEKEAREAYNKFSQACADAGMAGVKTCMDEAKACVTASEDEDTSSTGEFDNDFWRSIGLGNTNQQSFRNQSERQKKCSVYGLKDYETEKRERSRSLRDAQKEMADLQKDLAKEKKELAEKKKELSEDFVKMQADMRKEMTEQQKAQAEEGMQAQQQMMEIDQQKAELRAANIQARSQSAKITGQRAVELAGLSDAMIHTNCMVELEKAISEMKAGLVGGSNNYMAGYAERKRRLLSIKELCYARYEAARASTYKSYKAEIEAVDNSVAENNRRIAALDDQKTKISENQATAIQRAQTAQQQANSELYQKMQAVQTQMQEMNASAQQAEMSANQNIQQAQQRMNEAISDIRDLGAKPKGLKQPTEAASQFRAFANTVKAMETDVACKDETDRLVKMVSDASLKDYYDNDISGDGEDAGRD